VNHPDTVVSVWPDILFAAMTNENRDEYWEALKLGTAAEKLAALRELEETAKKIREHTEPELFAFHNAVIPEKLKPWREFRGVVGFPVFNIMLELAQSDAHHGLRDLAADILAHLWHPAAVDRLVVDIKRNSKTLRPSQISGIFINLGGIGNEPAVRALISLWRHRWKFHIPAALAACDSKTAESFLMTHARKAKDPNVRASCLFALNSEVSDRKISLLLERLEHGGHFEQAAAITKIKDIGLASLVPALKAISSKSKDPILKDHIAQALRKMRMR